MDLRSKSFLNLRESVKTNKYFVIVFLLATLVLLLPTAFNLLPTMQQSVGKIEKQTRNNGSKVLNGEAICQAMSNGDEINIKISGNLTELYNYQNLFQTSDMNTGIRFEIDGSGQGGLLIRSYAADGFSGLLIPKKFVVGPFDIAIRIKDGSTVLVTFMNINTEKVLTELKPKCDNFIVGYGYDPTRVIKGEVRFEATILDSKPRFVPSWLDNGVRVDWFRALISSLFFFTALSIAFKMSSDTEDEIHDAHEKQDRV
jgi:hypothetical protein